MGSAEEKDKLRKEIGRLGEDIATQYLVRKGFQIIERNYRKPWGEIDIIAAKGKTIRFVEVKTISRENIETRFDNGNDYHPEEMVHPFKLKKIARTADLYMTNKKEDLDFQIDVVSVIIDTKSRVAHCQLFEQVL